MYTNWPCVTYYAKSNFKVYLQDILPAVSMAVQFIYIIIGSTGLSVYKVIPRCVGVTMEDF